MSTVVVTGGAGFIGSHLVEALLRAGRNVRVLDDLSAGQLTNLHAVAGDVEVIRGSVLDDDAVSASCRGATTVYHLAAQPSAAQSAQTPRTTFDANVVGLLHVLEGARTAGARFVFASSVAAYGDAQYLPLDEKHPTHPSSVYGATKLAGEALADAYAATYGVEVVVARIFNTYGPRQRRGFLVPDMLQKIDHATLTLDVLGAGSQQKDFGYVTDIARALLLVGAAPPGRYNVAGGHAISVRDVVQRLLVIWGRPDLQVNYGGTSWVGDSPALVADCSRLQSVTGFRPEVAFDDGLRRCVDSYRETHLTAVGPDAP